MQSKVLFLHHTTSFCFLQGVETGLLSEVAGVVFHQQKGKCDHASYGSAGR